MAALASDWLTHFPLLWNRCTETQDCRHCIWLAETFSTSLQLLNGIKWNPTGSKISTCSTKYVFSGRSENPDGRYGLWSAEIFLTSSLEPLNRIQQNLTGSKISTFSTKFVFFMSIRKPRWPADWLRYFRLILCNHWTKVNETWQEAKSHRPLPRLEVCVFGPIGNPRWPPLPLIGRDIFGFFSDITERNMTKFDRKQDFHVLYKILLSGLPENQNGRSDLWWAQTFSTSSL